MGIILGILIEYGILELFGNNGEQLRILCIRTEKYFTNYVEKVKNVECEEESKDVFHSGFIIDNESINESKISNFSGLTSTRIR